MRLFAVYALAAVLCTLNPLGPRFARAGDPWQTPAGKVVRVQQIVTLADGRRIAIEESADAYVAEKAAAQPAKSPAAVGCPTCGKDCDCGPACACDSKSWAATCGAAPRVRLAAVPCEVQGNVPVTAPAPPPVIPPAAPPAYYGPPRAVYPAAAPMPGTYYASAPYGTPAGFAPARSVGLGFSGPRGAGFFLGAQSGGACAPGGT